MLSLWPNPTYLPDLIHLHYPAQMEYIAKQIHLRSEEAAAREKLHEFKKQVYIDYM